jgi:ATP-binding cassette subfamily B protein
MALHSVSHYTEHGHQHSAHGHSNESLLLRLYRLLAQEKRDLWVLVIYSIISGVFSLIVPLSSQAIVNSVQLGVVTIQLIVLCTAIGIGMLVLGIFTVLETYLIDILQRRLFARAAFEVASRLSHIRSDAFYGEYPPEVVNRFFDVLTIQKTLSKLLLDGLSASLVALVGLILLAIYHPIFLLFDIILFLFVVIVVFVLSKGGVETSIKESKKKYALVHWLEDVARCHTSFKLYGRDDYVLERVDAITGEYVNARKKHFRVLARQLIGSSIFRAIATVGILGLGGFLVIEQSLSIGQLVAAEIVILSVLNSIEKLITQFEQVYDLLTAIDKLAHITDKPLETEAGTPYIRAEVAPSLQFDNVSFSYPNGKKVLHHINLNIPPGQGIHASIVGAAGAGKTTLANVLVRLYDIQEGNIFINNQNIRHLRLRDLRSIVSIIQGTIEVFAGTIRDNILLGRQFAHDDIMWALKMAGIYDDVMSLRDGLETMFGGTGSDEVPESLLRCITVARAVIGKPQIIVLDDVLSGLTEALKSKIINNLYSSDLWTILDISQDPDIIRRAKMIIILEEGIVVETAPMSELARQPESRFRKLFPTLSAQVLAGT